MLGITADFEIFYVVKLNQRVENITINDPFENNFDKIKADIL